MPRLDPLTPEERSGRMSLIRGKDTKPELAVRKLVHGMGFRYRLHARDLPGNPDLVFRSRFKVIFVHGCFWHQHGCGNYRMPRTKRSFWIPKLDGNRARDARIRRELCKLGWRSLTVWECELKELARLRARIRRFLEK